MELKKNKDDVNYSKGECINDLKENIYNLVYYLDTDHVLSEEQREKMTRRLSNWVENATIKFIRGQKEHGGNISDRNIYKEIYGETIDLFWYNEENGPKV